MTKQYETHPTLRQLRKLAGVTQTEMASRVGSVQHVVSRTELQDDVKLSTFKRYLAALGLEIEIVSIKKQNGCHE